MQWSTGSLTRYGDIVFTQILQCVSISWDLSSLLDVIGWLGDSAINQFIVSVLWLRV